MLLHTLNQLLAHNTTARENLQKFSGKRIVFDVKPFAVEAQINERGFLVATAQSANAATNAQAQTLAPDLKVSFPLTAAPLVLLGKEMVSQEIHVQGNVALANAVSAMWQHLPLALEAQTERLVGPVIAHRVAQTGNSLFGVFKRAHEGIGRNLSHALKHERGPLPSTQSVQSMSQEINMLTQRVEALAARLNRL